MEEEHEVKHARLRLEAVTQHAEHHADSARALLDDFKRYNEHLIRLRKGDAVTNMRYIHTLGTGELYGLRMYLQRYGGQEHYIAAIDTELNNTE